MVAIIIIIVGVLVITLLVKNSELSHDNKQFKITNLSDEIYEEYKRQSTSNLEKTKKELHTEYYELLDKAKVRYEKDDNKEEYGDSIYELPDGTVASNPAENQKYMTYNDYETNLYLRYNIVNNIINKRKNKN